MKFNDVFDVLGGIVVIGMITALVSRGRQSAQVINAFGNAFGGSIRAALGR